MLRSSDSCHLVCIRVFTHGVTTLLLSEEQALVIFVSHVAMMNVAISKMNG